MASEEVIQEVLPFELSAVKDVLLTLFDVEVRKIRRKRSIKMRMHLCYYFFQFSTL